MSLVFNIVTCDRRRKRNQRPLFLGVAVALLGSALNMGCGSTLRDVSGEPPYAAMIGHTYRIVGDVDALGVWDSHPDGQPSYILLDPRPSLTGPEIRFNRPLERGQTFRIIGARHRDHILEDSFYYLVELTKDLQTPPLPVHLNLNDRNHSGNGELNQQIYERVK